MTARSIRVRGVVQGVGFRPFVYNLALANSLAGWVLNGEEGVEIYLEGEDASLDTFVRDLERDMPLAARIAAVDIEKAPLRGVKDFTIVPSRRNGRPSVRISADLPVCEECLREMFDPADRRYLYPYINCTHCGPRYSVIESLPYDRANTTMKDWPFDQECAGEYHDPGDRRFHAQPTACPACGPNYSLRIGEETVAGGNGSVGLAAQLLREGKIVAVKGIGGYHLAVDAGNPEAVLALRGRKYRKEKPFAVMTRDLEIARRLLDLSPDAESLLTSQARPIVLAPRKQELPHVAPESGELGVMLPYAPLHYLLFAAGAPEILVLTSANRSSEPIAYEDQDARTRLSSIADAFLIGERRIARRVDDSVARAGCFGPVILRRSRGYAPGVLATLPTRRPILALGADLKNTVTLVVEGQALMSQHIGDLDHYESREAFRETIEDLVSMYGIGWNDLLLVHDSHPQYVSTLAARKMEAAETIAVQHHRAHIASVLAEREAWRERVIGASFDGTGYGDDGTIWGGEIFIGGLEEGFERVAHLRQALLPGGDAAARNPVQCAAGFLAQLADLPDLRAAPFGFSKRYEQSLQLVRKDVRSFPATSVGRLFDAAAALAGFTREITYEGQAAMWLETLAQSSFATSQYPFPLRGDELDFRPLLEAVVRDRIRGRAPEEIARAFHRGVAEGVSNAVRTLSQSTGVRTLVLSGGVFQNAVLLREIHSRLTSSQIQVWTNRLAPPNDGGISLGQAAIAACRPGAADA